MKHVVMGTAGHIDHGKTSLVKELTGIDTDRLKEEKNRGMTIELGFASMILPSGAELSIVDVPGHEKFVKTMVAGATGIDFAMLVIAADEGVMPQTQEHIDILNLLGVTTGLVALTKSDLVDESELELRKEEIRDYVKEYWTEGISILPVSSRTGEGIKDLIDKIDEMTARASEKNHRQLFRMPVDRVFTMTGHGTVVTGTVSGGAITKGEVVDVLPEGIKAKVRGIQVHNKQVERAITGDRCALNIYGLDKSEISRGSVIAETGMVEPVMLADAMIRSIKGKGDIHHNQRVHVNIGTKEVLARIRLIGTELITSGNSGFCQLRFEEPTVALRGDRFILRSYSPVTTIGGGIILFHRSKNRKRTDDESLKFLRLANLPDSKKLIEYILKESDHFVSIEELYRDLLEDKEIIKNILQGEITAYKAGYIKETDKYFGIEFYQKSILEINSQFDRLAATHPYRFQITKEEIKSRLFPEMAAKDFNALINYLAAQEKFQLKDNMLESNERDKIDGILKRKEVMALLAYLKSNRSNCVTARQAAEETRYNIKQTEEILKFLQAAQKVIKLDDDQYMDAQEVKAAFRILKSELQKKGMITVADFRDLLNTGRKTAMLILEYFDSVNVTVREGNFRKPGIHLKDFE